MFTLLHVIILDGNKISFQDNTSSQWQKYVFFTLVVMAVLAD